MLLIMSLRWFHDTTQVTFNFHWYWNCQLTFLLVFLLFFRRRIFALQRDGFELFALLSISSNAEAIRTHRRQSSSHHVYWNSQWLCRIAAQHAHHVCQGDDRLSRFGIARNVVSTLGAEVDWKSSRASKEDHQSGFRLFVTSSVVGVLSW